MLTVSDIHDTIVSDIEPKRFPDGSVRLVSHKDPVMLRTPRMKLLNDFRPGEGTIDFDLVHTRSDIRALQQLLAAICDRAGVVVPPGDPQKLSIEVRLDCNGEPQADFRGGPLATDYHIRAGQYITAVMLCTGMLPGDAMPRWTLISADIEPSDELVGFSIDFADGDSSSSALSEG